MITLVAAHMAPVLVATALLLLQRSVSDPAKVGQMLFSVFLVVIFLALNSSLSLLNRWALGVHGFSFPLSLTAVHMLFGCCALAPPMMLSAHYSAAHEPILRQNGKAIALIGALNGLQIACNNASLIRIELSLNQIIRGFGPLIVAALAVCVEGKWTSPGQGAALLTVGVGVLLTTVKMAVDDKTTLAGVLLTLASITMQCLILTLSSRIMSTSTKLDGLQMAFYQGPFAFLVLVPLTLMHERAAFARALVAEPLVALGFLLGSSVMAVAYNIVVFQSSKTLSSVGTSLLANVKIIVLFILSKALLGEMAAWQLREYVGCVLTVGGTAVYSRLKMLQQSR